MPRQFVLLFSVGILALAAAIAQAPQLRNAHAAGQRALQTPGTRPPSARVDYRPGPMFTRRNVVTPGDQFPLTDPFPANTPAASAFDPADYKVFIKAASGTDTWELSPILMSGWTYNIPEPVGNRQIPSTRIQDIEMDRTDYGPRAVAVSCTIPQLPKGAYQVWHEQKGSKGPVRSITIHPKL